MDQSSPIPQRTTNYRWMICFLLFLVTTVNYMDRGVISILKTPLRMTCIGAKSITAILFSVFSWAMRFHILLMGRLIDRIGVRHGLGLAVILWSLPR